VNFHKALGVRVRRARLDVGFKQRELAVLLKMPRSAVSELEHGRRGMSAVELFRLCDATAISAEWFLGLAPSPEKIRLVVHGR